MVNGLGRDEGKVANGMGCLAAQLIADIKKNPGNVYLEKPDSKRSWIDYVYYVWVKENKGIYLSVFNYNDKCIFVGKPYKLIQKYKDD